MSKVNDGNGRANVYEKMIGGRRSFLRGAGALLTLAFLESAPALLATEPASSGTKAAEPKTRLV